MNRVIDPSRFALDATAIDWLVEARRRNQMGGRLSDKNLPRRLVQLRWMIGRQIGMPTEPFVVWRRPSTRADLAKDVAFDSSSLPPLGEIVFWAGALSSVTVTVTSPGSGFVAAFVGPPIVTRIVAVQPVAAGTQQLTFGGGAFNGLVLTTGITVTALAGVTAEAATLAHDWQPIEVVGLPVDQAAWTDVDDWSKPQGLVGAEGDPRRAAFDRLGRGAPPFGWADFLEAGVPAPAWIPPDPGALIDELQRDAVKPLHDILLMDALDQVLHTLGIDVPPPQNPAGEQMTDSGPSTADYPPLGIVLVGAATDPYLSLGLGFGTAYDETADKVEGQGIHYDYMVTGVWKRGVERSVGEPVEFAAIALDPKPAVGPPAPANMVAEWLGWTGPYGTDNPWTGTVQASWDRLPANGLLRVASFAASRRSTSPAAPPVLLNEPRGAGGIRPIAGTSSQADPETWRIKAVDRDLTIPPDPGAIAARYSAATQNVFGLWSAWASADVIVGQPAPRIPAIVATSLTATAPGSGTTCPATLVVELTWDWTDRTPGQFELRSRLWDAASRGQQPPDPSVGPRFERSVGDTTSSGIVLTFAGDTVTAPTGVAVEYLDADGTSLVAAGTAQGATRRYRVHVDDLAIAFPLGHVGAVVWARAAERIPPARVSDWSTPGTTDASDPIPNVMVRHVLLASLPDAKGESHARIDWPASPGAAGYFVHETTETALRAAAAMGAPDPDSTFDQRLAEILAAYDATPSRAPFKRLNAQAITDTSMDVTLPRGSADVHVYAITATNPGQIESAWPAAGADLVTVAAPRVAVPQPPTVEVRRVDVPGSPPGFAAHVTIRTRLGAAVDRVDLHRVRVDDAARELDSMGPPVATINAMAPGWTVAPLTETRLVRGVEQHVVMDLGSLTGVDPVPGSWRRVWYRAVCWSRPDPSRGLLAGRGLASPAASVVVPPTGPPDLSPVSVEWAGGALTDVLLRFTSAAPVPKTPLGPHVLDVTVTDPGAPSGTPPIVAARSPIDAVPTILPAAGSGLCRVDGVPMEYRVLVRRSADGSGNPLACSATVRLTDPLGRQSVQVVSVPAGPVDPAPDVGGLQAGHEPGFVAVAFTSNSPTAHRLAGDYRLRITATPAAVHFPPIPVPHPFGPITPLPPQPVLPGGPGGIHIGGGRIGGGGGIGGIIGGKPQPVVLDVALADVPRQVGHQPLGGTVPIAVARGLGNQYLARCPAGTAVVAVRITAPDGRFAEDHTGVS